jgi:hypothetical protein
MRKRFFLAPSATLLLVALLAGLAGSTAAEAGPG